MANRQSIPAAFRRTYELTVPVHDVRGDAPSMDGVEVDIVLVRRDGGARATLFGPDGLLVGNMTAREFTATPRPVGSALSPISAVFDLVPNGYFFVDTEYVLTLSGRQYHFQMPPADSHLIDLLAAGPITPAHIGTSLGVPAGTDILNRLQWDSTIPGWRAVSDVTTVYDVLTRMDDPNVVVGALLHALSHAGNKFPPDDTIPGGLAFSINVGYVSNTFKESVQHQQINNVWLAGAANPYAWVLAPDRLDWVENFELVYSLAGGPVPQSDFQIRRNYIRINGVPYAVGVVQTVGGRAAVASFEFNYVAPVQAAPSVALIP